MQAIKNPATHNRREFVRVAPAADAPVRVNINGEDFIEVTNALDISEGGVRISVRHGFAGCRIDSLASLVFYLPAPVNKHVSLKGRIKHALGDSYGVQFGGMSEVNRALLRRYVASRLDQPPGRWWQGYFGNLLKAVR